MKVFKEVNCYIDGIGIIKTSLYYKDGYIQAIGLKDIVAEEVKVANNWLVLPGFIDQHVHGAAGFDTMDGSIEALSIISKTIASEGVTTFCPTTMTQSYENITMALKNVQEYLKLPQQGARVHGVHLEGPFIAKDYIGAQPLKYVQEPNVKLFEHYRSSSGNNIAIVTLAPEVSKSDELIKHLVNEKIVVSLGHTAARYHDIKNAVNLGAINLTHTYNAMRPLHHREIGTVGAAFMIDELTCEMICDGIHVSIPAMQLLAKIKPTDKLVLVTDAMRAKHLGEGISELGGQEVMVKNNEARLMDGTLAGSVLTMEKAVWNAHTLVGLPLTKAIDLATINPAKLLGIDDLEGSIKVGKKANFVVVDADFNVQMTISEGKIIYQKK